jgi:hypothetical protein
MVGFSEVIPKILLSENFNFFTGAMFEITVYFLNLKIEGFILKKLKFSESYSSESKIFGITSENPTI